MNGKAQQLAAERPQQRFSLKSPDQHASFLLGVLRKAEGVKIPWQGLMPLPPLGVEIDTGLRRSGRAKAVGVAAPAGKTFSELLVGGQSPFVPVAQS